MIKHYLKNAIRNIRKNRTQSLISIFGLAFGLACFILALYWFHYETSYDKYYPHAEHIYRVYAVEKQSKKVNELIPAILERTMREKFPSIESSVGFMIWPEKCSTERMPYIQLNMLYTDSTIFEVFPQIFVSGDIQHSLQVLNNIVITETLAIRLFGNVNRAIGQHIKSIMIPSYPPYTVTAVIKDQPPNTNLSFDAIIYHDIIKSQKSFDEESLEEAWSSFQLISYVKIHPLSDINKLSEQLRDFPSQLHSNANFEAQMLPICDVRHKFNANIPFTLNFILLFITAGILLMFSALFNFLNLHIDLFYQRISEFRLRAVHGAKSWQLVGQMMFELTIIILIAFALTYCFVILTRPVFSELLDITMKTSQLIRLFVICVAAVLMLMMFISSIFLWRLSSLAVRHLSKKKIMHKQPILRRMAVILQLAVSIVLIVASLVVMLQMRFINRKDMGFDQSRIIQLSEIMDYSRGRNVWITLKHELETIPQIETFTQTYFKPKHSISTSFPEILTELEWKGKLPDKKPVFHAINVDDRFSETFGLKMLMGEWFDKGRTHTIVLNEKAVSVMGLSEPIGTIIRLHPDNILTNPIEEYEVVGVVKDFHVLSLRSNILPTIFFPFTATFMYTTYIRVVPGQEQEVIRRINNILPDIDVSMADVCLTPVTELYNQLNSSEQTALKLFSVLATVCLLISLLGIYTVTTASTQSRYKEVAIRKVVGAEVGDIVCVFLREYTNQVMIACIVAIPVSYYMMHNWLLGYAYRTNIPWWMLIGVITGVTSLVMFTVLGQVIKAANRNPIVGLRANEF